MKKKLLALMMVFAMLMSATPMAFARESRSVWDEMADEMAETKVKDALWTAVKLIEDNKEEIYTEAYQYAAEAGYIADVQAALNNLSAALGELEVEDLDKAVAELQKDIAAVNAFLDDAKDLDTFTDKIWDLLAEFADDKEVLDDLLTDAGEYGLEALEALEDAYNAILPCVDEIYTAAYEMMGEAYADVVEAISALAAEYGPAAEEFVREWLYENPKAVMETILAYGEDIDALLNHWNYHVGLILGPAWNAYGDDLVALIEDLMATLNSETAALTEEAAAALVEYVAGLNLDGQIEDIAEAVKTGSIAIGEEALAELTEIVAGLNVSIETKVDAVVDALETLAASEDTAAAKALIEQAIEDVLAMEDELMAELECIQKDLEYINEQLMVAVESVEGIGEEKIADLVAAVKYAVENPAEADFSEAVAHAEELLGLTCKALGIVGDAAKEIASLTEDISAAGAKIDAELIALNGELETAVGAIETTLTAAGVDAEALLVETWAAIDAFVTATADTVITDASALVAACELELTAAVNEFIAAIETALYKATHGDVTVDCVATYTAIGDEADAYTSALAEKLGVKVAPLSAETDLVTIEFGVEELSAFVNSQIAGMITDVVMDNETLVSWLNDPTIGPMVKDVLAGYGFDLTAEVAPLAWEKYLDETAIAVKDETLDGIATVLMDHDVMMETYSLDLGEMIESVLPQGISVDCVVEIPVAELLVAAVDNLLYAYVDTAAQCVATIEGIQETAPEAEVVILGLTNAAEELKIKIGNTEIDLGEYEDAIGTFANAHYFAYALLNGENTTFVADKDAEAIYAALNVTDLGHEWTAVVTAPTCTEAGYTTYTCAKCGETYTENGDAATGHAFGAWTDNGDGTHSRVCANDASHVETADHDFTNGDCVCGAKKPVEEDDKPSGGGGGGSSRKWHCPTCKTDICHSKAFSDLDLNAWYHEYTDYVLCKGMMNGMGGGIFAPNGETSRAMLTTIIYRIAGSPAVSGEMPFADVAAGQWYTDAILWAAENDIVLGYGDGNFGPMDTITREQIAALFFRFAELEGMKTNKSADLSAYNDANTIGAWAVDYVEWAVASGLMQGRSAHLLAPAAGTTRAETAALLERWCEEIAD